MLGSLSAGNRTVDQIILNRLAAVDGQCHANDLLSGIFKGKGILIGVQDIVLVGSDFLYIVTAERKVGFYRRKPGLVKGDDLDKTVCGNDRTTGRNKFFRSIKSEYDIADLAVIADLKQVVGFKHFLQRQGCSLSFIVERGRRFGDGYILACVDQFNRVDLFADNITVRRGDLLNLILAEINFLALGRAVRSGRDRIHDLALGITNRTVRGDNILGSADLKDRTCQSSLLIDRLIDRIVTVAVDTHIIEHLTGLGYGDGAFLCHVSFIDLNNGHAAFLSLGMFFGHIEVNRRAVQDISVRGLNLRQIISLAVRKLFRCYQRTVCVGIEGVNGGNGRIGKGHRYKLAVRIKDLKGRARIRNGLAGFRVHLYHSDIALKVGIVDKVTVGGFVLGDIYLEIGHQFSALPTADLMYGIDTVREHLGLTEAVFITDDHVTLGFFCIVIAAGRRQIDLKLGAGFGRFDLRAAIVGVLDDRNIALDDFFVHIRVDRIQFNGIVLGCRVHIVHGRIQQITLGRCDLTDRPVVAAGIVFGDKISVLVGGICVDQFRTLIHAIDRTAQRCVALCVTVRRTELFHRCVGSDRQRHRHQIFRHAAAFAGKFRIQFEHIGTPLFQDILELGFGQFIPGNIRRLLFRNNIADRRIHFLNGVTCTHQNIVEIGNAVFIGSCVFIHGNPAERNTVKPEGHTCVKTVLGGLFHGKVAAL